MKLLEGTAHAHLGTHHSTRTIEAELSMLVQRTNTIAGAEPCLEQQLNCVHKTLQKLQKEALAQ